MRKTNRDFCHKSRFAIPSHLIFKNHEKSHLGIFLHFNPHSCIFRYQLMSQNSTFGTRFLFWIERSRPDFVSNRPRAWKVEKLE